MADGELIVLTREQIVRRLAGLHGEKHLRRNDQVTVRDVAKWMGLSRRCVRSHATGAFPINDAHQITYSAFFALLDAGCLEVRMVGRFKHLVRVKPPKEPPERKARPFIDFSCMRLKMD